jgi:hypothetical protein
VILGDTLPVFRKMATPSLGAKQYYIKVKVKVKVTLEQATKAQRGSRGIALLFLQPRS